MLNKKLGERLQPWVPALFVPLIYRVYYALFRTAAWISAPGVPVWPRNSFVLGPMEFGRSDIDVTAWIRDSADKARVLRVKTFFPLIQEINWYREADRAVLLRVINPIELKRDPYLARKTGATLRAPTPAEQITFILRMTEALQEQIQHPSQWQFKKWKAYFERADLPHPPANPQELFAFFEKYLGASRFVREFFEAGARGEALHLTHKRWGGDERAAYAMALFPHRFCFVPSSPLALTPLLDAVMRAQIEWEIWGILSQAGGPLSETERTHLAHLQRWAKERWGDGFESPSSILSKILAER